MRRLSYGLYIIGMTAAASASQGEQAFGGHEAAIVDWAYRNCKLMGTDKEHALADAANAQGGARFQKQYQETQKSLALSQSGQDAVSDECAKIVQDYGPLGTRILGLVSAQSSSPEAQSGSEPGRAKPKDPSDRGKHHQHGQQNQ